MRVTIPLPSILSSAATITTIVPDLNISYMLSLGQLCDNGCYLLLKKQNMYAMKDKEVLIEGYKNYRYGLWGILLTLHPDEKNECPNQHLHHNSIPCKHLCRNS